MHRFRRWPLLMCLLAGLLSPFASVAQIDPVPRELIQLGYNAAFQGHAPLSAYAFYYRNQPHFLEQSNLTLRLAVAPTYLDAELGIRQVFGDDTDLGIGIAGGGFADSYDEIRRGKFLPRESFVGHGAQMSLGLYHCFNPGQQIPLNGIVRVIAHGAFFERDGDTADRFALPADRATFSLRSGLRWGGQEPILFPSLAMELSLWYEGQLRTDDSDYGFGDRSVERYSHLVWGQALLAYTFAESQHSLYLNLTAGASAKADRFSAYRLGALLPLVSEFPLSLPGYYYQEISAEDFVLLGGNYIIPLDEKQRWNFNIAAATAGVDYLDGLEQPGRWHSGVGGGILYRTSSLKLMVGYAYGIDAIRSSGRGAHSIGFLMQVDWENARQALLSPDQPRHWRGFQRVLGIFGD